MSTVKTGVALGGVIVQIEIYADVVFVVNFFMDFLILWFTGIIIRKKTRRIKLCLGAATAALLYCLSIFFLPYNLFTNMLCSEIVILTAIYITYKPKKIREFMLLVIVCHVCAFTIGGIITGLTYYTTIPSSIINLLDISIRNFSIYAFIIFSILSYLIISFINIIINKKTLAGQKFYDFTVELFGKQVRLRGLVDTGNTLYDPITKSPVVICEGNIIDSVFPKEIVCSQDNYSELMLQHHNAKYIKRIRLVPFNSVNCAHGILIGFKPDSFYLDDKQIKTDDVIIGVTNEPLSADNSYQALINPEILNYR